MPMTRKTRKKYNQWFAVYHPKKLTVKEGRFFERYFPDGARTEHEEPEPMHPIDTSSYKTLMRTIAEHYKRTFQTGLVRAKNRVNRYVKWKHAADMSDRLQRMTEQIHAFCSTIPDQPLVVGITLHGMLKVRNDAYVTAPVPFEMVYLNTASEGVDTLVDDRTAVFRNVYDGKTLHNVYAQMKEIVSTMKERLLEDSVQAKHFLKYSGVKMYRLSKGEALWQKDFLMRANETGRLFLATKTGEIDLLPLLTVRRHAAHEEEPVWYIRMKTLFSYLAKFKRPLIVADFSCNAFYEGGLGTQFHGTMTMKSKVGTFDKVAEHKSF
jgi:hypothetical protein